MELLLALPADVLAPQMARGALEVFASVFPPAFVDDMRLLTNELVTNAIKHGGLKPSEELEVRAESSVDRVRVEVVGGRRPLFQRPTTTAPYQSSGWGLLLVGTLSDRWGYQEQEETAVWFEMDRARRPTPDPIPPEVDRPRSGWNALRKQPRRSRAS